MPGKYSEFPVPLPIFGEKTAGSTSLQQAIRAAREDESLAAIILHVDSPGGSALASDLMTRAVSSCWDNETPLVIYMGDAAASGGYYVVTPGHKAIAQRAQPRPAALASFQPKPVTGQPMICSACSAPASNVGIMPALQRCQRLVRE